MWFLLRGLIYCFMAAAEGQLQGLVQAASGYHSVLAENRKLYNEVQDLKGKIKSGLLD